MAGEDAIRVTCQHKGKIILIYWEGPGLYGQRVEDDLA